jgi:hypothetical protein
VLLGIDMDEEIMVAVIVEASAEIVRSIRAR